MMCVVMVLFSFLTGCEETKKQPAEQPKIGENSENSAQKEEEDSKPKETTKRKKVSTREKKTAGKKSQKKARGGAKQEAGKKSVEPAAGSSDAASEGKESSGSKAEGDDASASKQDDAKKVSENSKSAKAKEKSAKAKNNQKQAESKKKVAATKQADQKKKAQAGKGTDIDKIKAKIQELQQLKDNDLYNWVSKNVATDIAKSRGFGKAFSGFSKDLKAAINKDWLFFLTTHIGSYVPFIKDVSIQSIKEEKVSQRIKKFVISAKGGADEKSDISVVVLCTENLRVIDVVVQEMSLLALLKTLISSIFTTGKGSTSNSETKLKAWRKFIAEERARKKSPAK
ncbi:MAG: hypothetical protein LBF72_02370 [Holosporales bacterium]|nr:hypothetical protein [Holosporales bacterium]